MFTLTTTRYSFNELSDDAKARAIDACRFYNVDDSFWSESTIEHWQDERLPASGITDAKISYSGFWSQGDGAGIYEGSIDLAAWMKSQKIANKYRALYDAACSRTAAVDCSAYLEPRRGYSNYRQATPHLECRSYLYQHSGSSWQEQDTRLNNQATDVEELLIEWWRDQESEIYKQLSDEYDYQTDDEQVSETILANDYDFDEEGNR